MAQKLVARDFQDGYYRADGRIVKVTSKKAKIVQTLIDKQARASSVTLIILGDDLDPSEVTRVFGTFPDQAWRAREAPEIQTPNGRWIQIPRAAECGGRKKFMPKELRNELLEGQLEHWIMELGSKSEIVRGLQGRGWSVTLDCVISTSEVDVAELKADLLAKLAAIGTDVDIHFYATDGENRKGPEAVESRLV